MGVVEYFKTIKCVLFHGVPHEHEHEFLSYRVSKQKDINVIDAKYKTTCCKCKSKHIVNRIFPFTKKRRFIRQGGQVDNKATAILKAKNFKKEK